MRIIYSIVFILSAFICLSCGRNDKQSQSNLSGSIDEETKFARSLYGENTDVIAKGDLLGNGNSCAVAAVVKQKTENSYWIEKASMFQKVNGELKVILKMEEKLTTPNGELVKQVDSKYGYIISFDTSSKPVAINIMIANEYGKGASDEAVIRWDEKINDFKFTAPYDEYPK